ncbi:MAG: BMP family ABC transporter substrate-binding protein, partial [Anaerolineales bacterium]
MDRNRLWWVAGCLAAGALLLGACGGAQATPEVVGGFEIPAIEEGKFNVAMVLIGPHDDGGWSQAHYEGLLFVEENVPDVHVAYIENVPEGADSEQIFRSLSRKGFD